MARSVLSLLIVVMLFLPHSIEAQEATSYKSFTKYSGLVPGVDFFASKKQLASPYEKPIAQVVARLKTLLDKPLPKGSVFICSTLEQKDSIYEPMILKMGYAWTLSIDSPEIQAELMMERIRSRMGDDIPAELLEQFRNRQPSMMASAENRMVQDTARRVSYAIIQTTFAKNLKYRSSRLNDMGKSPLPDWLDIGITAYATGEDPNLSYLLQNMEQTFPIEDVLTMSRPFVASTFLQNNGSGGGRGSFGPGGGNPGDMGGGQGFPSGGFSGMGQGGFPQGGFSGMGQGSFPQGGFGGRSGGSQGGMEGQRGSRQRTIPKDEQDEMIFDGESSTFFAFLLEKVGIEKVRELINAVQEGVEGRDFIAREDMLGGDYRIIEDEWTDWIQKLEPQPPLPESGMPNAKERR